MKIHQKRLYPLAIFVLLIVSSSSLQAIPAFGRKYGKPCQTCHVAIPKLNDFGERVRINGYQLPGTIEDIAPWSFQAVHFSGMLHEMFVQRTIKSGMSAVPPTGLPGNGQYDVNSFRDPGGHLWMGGVLGRHLSFFAAFGIEQELEVEGGRFKSSMGVHWEQAFFAWNNVLSSGTGRLNLRFGRFELELPFSSLRRLSSALSPYEIYSIQPVKGATNLSSSKVGASVFGAYSFGVNRVNYDLSLVNGANGNFDTNIAKDIYGRLALSRYFDSAIKKVTIGGLGYLGSQNLKDLPGNPFPNEAMLDYWDDEGGLNVHISPENAAFTRLGLDASLDVILLGHHLNLFGQYLIGHNDDIDMTNEDMPYLESGGGDEGGGGHAHKALTPTSGLHDWVERPFDYSGGFIGTDIILIPARFYLSPRFDWVNVTNQWADDVDGMDVRMMGSYDIVDGMDTTTYMWSDGMLRTMTGNANVITRFTVQLHYHPIQPVAMMLEFGSQKNMFGYPEPPISMYNPTWVAGMGRVVKVDSNWLMFMIMFAF